MNWTELKAQDRLQDGIIAFLNNNFEKAVEIVHEIPVAVINSLSVSSIRAYDMILLAIGEGR